MCIDNWSLLAALRFALSFIVVICHLNYFAPSSLFLGGTASFEAVIGFLAISGYSIGYSYKVNPEYFYRRRIKRIYPIYILALSLSITQSGPLSIDVVVSNLLFLNQITTSSSLVEPAWSLSLEVWLYALTPIIARLSKNTLLRLAACSFAAWALYTALLVTVHAPYYAQIGGGLNLLLLSSFWLIGFGISQNYKNNEGVLGLALIFLLVCIEHAALQLFYNIIKNKDLGQYLCDIKILIWQAVVLATVFVMLRRAALNPAGRKHTTLVWLGDISYPLYIMHYPVFRFLGEWGVTNPVYFIICAIVVSIVAHEIIERPVQYLGVR